MKKTPKSLYEDIRSGDFIRIGGKQYTVEVADTFMSRFLGLMGRKSLPSDRALLIKPCSSIHTFFMRFRMTAIFVDKTMRVVKVVPDMAPWRLAFAPGSYSVFELVGDEGHDVCEGDYLTDLYRRVENSPSPKMELAPVVSASRNL